MTDRELLTELFKLINGCNFILGDEPMCRDMTRRYTNPPFTLHRRAIMQMTINDYQRLGTLLLKINAHLNPPPQPSPNGGNDATEPQPESV